MSKIVISGPATDIAVLECLSPADLFAANGTEPVYEAIKNEVAAFVPDMTTEGGRKEIASMAYKIAQSKNFLDKVGKIFNSDLKEKTKAVDAERKAIWDKLEALQKEVRKPLDEFEAQETLRVEAHKKALQDMDELAGAAYVSTATIDQIQICVSSIGALSDRDWEEFASYAQERIAHHKEALVVRLQKAEQAERDRLELEELRRLKAEQEAKAAEEARKKAAEEERARIEREAAEKAQRDAAAILQAEKDRAAKAEADAAAALKAAEDRAAREKAEADERARKSEEARIAAEAKAKLEADAAVQRERDRAAAEAKRAEDDARARENDRKHHARINNEVLHAILSLIFSDDPEVLNDAQRMTGRVVVEAIAKGGVPHVKISY